MGWTGHAPRYDGDKKQWLIDEFTSENADFRWTISDLSIKGSEAYCIHHQERSEEHTS